MLHLEAELLDVLPLLSSFRSSRKMLGSDRSVEARMRIRSGHQFSISWSARALTTRRPSLVLLGGNAVLPRPTLPEESQGNSVHAVDRPPDLGLGVDGVRIMQASATTPSARPDSAEIAAGTPGRSHARVGGPKTGRPSSWSPGSCSARGTG